MEIHRDERLAGIYAFKIGTLLLNKHKLPI